MKRNEIINKLSNEWDIIIIGGGITGAGIFNETSKQGYKTLLVEQHDFGWGTSSRSAKLVHGGLRYLGQGQIKTTWHCVTEREKLLAEYKNLIQPLRFLYPAYKKDITSHLLGLGLTFYDLMAGRKDHLYHEKIDFLMQAPSLKEKDLRGGYSFTDATTDDARLVLRVISDGENNGGAAINYLYVNDFIKNNNGQIKGINAIDKENGNKYEIKAKVVINAAGIFSDILTSKVGKKPILRKLRGSHIIFPHWRFPLYQAISFTHPIDGRPLYVIPWQGMTLYGTTDLEHSEDIYNEPRINKKESEYLFAALEDFFPSLNLTKADAISTFSGVRSVINTGKEDPSKESREYNISSESGLISVMGGKLTTFRLIALDVIREINRYIPNPKKEKSNKLFKKINENNQNSETFNRLYRTFGNQAKEIISNEELLSLGYIENTDVMWAELIWSARSEQVVHLEDLMLRRTRLGLTTENGGIHLFDKIEKYVAKDLNYDKIKFEEEKTKYLKLWQDFYSPDLL